MKIRNFLVPLFVGLLTNCGSSNHGSQSQILATSAVIVVKDTQGYPVATIDTRVALENAAFKSEGGWEILSWNSRDRGTAVIKMGGGQVVDASVGQGTGVIIAGEGHRLLTSGAVSGSFTYICGPQGARCRVDIPPLVGDLTYPCGPQGAVCRVSIPGVNP